ncbi:hypothetical protein B0T25DRAFT_537093 [Lasiosphaeria hispida]|uniref:Uncharacterized protein n=1 Tax=Lasiosphaeria hispida TaxID=260671 RepID=A0AAJ0HKR0_9PEZI|nr:hypothetical protein B0T25DRAFT_537093 [Lasiosphaeria hispida]
MSVFVNYGGPSLDKKQQRIVRSQAMVSVRGQQKQARSRDAAEATTSGLTVRPLAPAQDDEYDGSHAVALDDEADKRGVVAQQTVARSNRPAPNSSRRRDKAIVARAFVARQRLNGNENPWDLRGAPPQSTHMTGVDARTFQDYLSRCGSYSSYLDEGFILVGFRQPSYFRPDLSKAACIYIGWLLTAGMLDAFRGSETIAYPYYEYQAVKELQRFIDGADERELHEVVYPVVILGMFEMFRLNRRAITHLAAVESFIKSRGGLGKMPDVMQHIVIMADILQCICLETPLAFNVLGPAPVMCVMTPDVFLAGDQLRSCPLLLCDNEDFSLAAQYVDPAIRPQLETVLTAANNSFRRFFGSGVPSSFTEDNAVNRELDAIADHSAVAKNVSGLFLETCALATRIMRRMLSGEWDRFGSDPANEIDALTICENNRFIGLKAWMGLPYVYVWVNLIGLSASNDKRLRSYFIAEVVRSAFSYGCYQIDVFQVVLKNYLHLRNAIADRKADVAEALGRL